MTSAHQKTPETAQGEHDDSTWESSCRLGDLDQVRMLDIPKHAPEVNHDDQLKFCAVVRMV